MEFCVLLSLLHLCMDIRCRKNIRFRFFVGCLQWNSSRVTVFNPHKQVKGADNRDLTHLISSMWLDYIVEWFRALSFCFSKFWSECISLIRALVRLGKLSHAMDSPIFSPIPLCDLCQWGLFTGNEEWHTLQPPAVSDIPCPHWEKELQLADGSWSMFPPISLKLCALSISFVQHLTRTLHLFGMMCMKYGQNHFLKALFCVLQSFFCALFTRPLCARTRAQLRGNLVLVMHALGNTFLLRQNQWRFYIGARGAKPPKSRKRKDLAPPNSKGRT